LSEFFVILSLVESNALPCPQATQLFPIKSVPQSFRKFYVFFEKGKTLKSIAELRALIWLGN
jgi:hypothetical protein